MGCYRNTLLFTVQVLEAYTKQLEHFCGLTFIVLYGVLDEILGILILHWVQFRTVLTSEAHGHCAHCSGDLRRDASIT